MLGPQFSEFEQRSHSSFSAEVRVGVQKSEKVRDQKSESEVIVRKISDSESKKLEKKIQSQKLQSE